MNIATYLQDTLFTYQVVVFVLAAFVGFEVISKVPAMLHTPLMSGTNFIHGVVLVGGIVVTSEAPNDTVKWIGFFAVVFGTLNVVGGWAVTDRMLEMFKSRGADRGKEGGA